MMISLPLVNKHFITTVTKKKKKKPLNCTTFLISRELSGKSQYFLICLPPSPLTPAQFITLTSPGPNLFLASKADSAIK